MRLALIAVLSLSMSARADESAWKVLPIYGGGWIQNVEISRSAPNVWYTYVDVGGPYRSDDAGRHWRPLHGAMTGDQRDVRADHVRTLSVDPRDADSFVMVAGDRFGIPAGVYVSRDGGKSFRRTLVARFYGDGNRRPTGLALARHPQDPDTLLCGEDWDGLFLSRDNGESWRALPVGVESRFSDVRWDRTDGDVAYASAADMPQDSHVEPWHPQARKPGFWRSDDRGETWRKLAADGPLEIAQIPGGRRIVGIFAGSELRFSDDRGETWRPFHEGLPRRRDGKTPDWRDREHFMALAAGPDFWLCGNTLGHIFRRGKDDSAWTEIACESETFGTACEDNLENVRRRREKWALSTIVIDERDPAHWLTTDWHLIWETHDAGRNWISRVDGMMQLVPFRVSCDPNSDANILVGLADMGMGASTDGGRTYHDVPQTGGANSIAWCVKHPGVAFATGGKSGIQLIGTRDGGKTWFYLGRKGLPPLRKGQPDGEKDHGAYDVAVDPTTDFVYLCVSGPAGKDGGGVYRSRDLGASWERFSDGLPEGGNLFKFSEFSGGGAAGWTPQLVFGADGSAVLSTFAKGVLYFLDREAGKWKALAYPANPSCSRTVAADPFRPGRFLFANDGHLIESLDGGRTWRQLYSTYGCGTCVAFDAHTRDLVVSANHDDVLISRDGGYHFHSLRDGLKIPSGNKRWVYVDRERLWFLTRGSGVYVRNVSKTNRKDGKE